MQRSYLVKNSVNFTNFGFFVKVGDILVHEPANANKLTVYRNGAVVRDIQQTTLGLAAMVKNGVLEAIQSPVAPKTAPKAPQKPIPAPAPKPEPKKEEKPKKEASAVNWGGVDMSTKPKPKPEIKPEPKPEPKPDTKKAVKAAVRELEIEDETI